MKMCYDSHLEKLLYEQLIINRSKYQVSAIQQSTLETKRFCCIYEGPQSRFTIQTSVHVGSAYTKSKLIDETHPAWISPVTFWTYAKPMFSAGSNFINNICGDEN